MENQLTTDGSESGIQSVGTSAQAAERVVSIMDFDSTGMTTCLATKPLLAASALFAIRYLRDRLRWMSGVGLMVSSKPAGLLLAE